MSIITTPNNNDIIDSFEVVYDNNDTLLDNPCISDVNYICSQIWKVKANNVNCPYSFDGNYSFQWNAVCSNSPIDIDSVSCQQYLDQNGEIVTLSADLSFSDTICDAEIWEINFDGGITFYTNGNYNVIQETDYEYIIGIDRIC